MAADSYNHRIRTIAGGQVASQYQYPYYVQLDVSGNLIIVDDQNHRIRMISSGLVSTLAGSAVSGYLDGPAGQAQFGGPKGGAMDSLGRILIADQGNNRIRSLWSNQVGTVAGDGSKAFADGPVGTAKFNYPTGVAVASKGRILVADQQNHRIRMIIP